MNVSRDLLENVKPFLKRKEFLAITGPRQAGKTTFLELVKQHLIKDKKFKESQIVIVSFEDRKALTQFEADPAAFVRSYIPQGMKSEMVLMLDEFQYADQGGQKLKLVYDTVKGVKVIITGSSSLEINAQIGKYMVGRILSFHLAPFSFGEFLRSRNVRLEKIYADHREKLWTFILRGKRINLKEGEDLFFENLVQDYEFYAVWGGYPAVLLSRTDRERTKVLNDLFNNYVLKDVKGLLSLATDRNLLLLDRYLAAQMGNITVYQNLSQVSGLDHRQLKKHLNILKETFICDEVRPYFTNRQKELSKNHKIYFWDLGFRNHLLENMGSLEKRPDSGAMIENVAYVHLSHARNEGGTLNFWRTKSGAEVDFILRLQGGLIPLEVKYSPFESCKASRSFLSFVESFKPQRGVILTKNFWGKMKKDGMEIIFAPVYYL